LPVNLIFVLSFLQEIQMKRLLALLAVVFTLGLSIVAMEAEAAKRMGSGKYTGTDGFVGDEIAAQAETGGRTQ